MTSRTNRSRAWFFTVDNVGIGDAAQFELNLRNTGISDYVFQLERAESGMIHFQGVCRFDNPRENWPDIQCHWERCRNWRAAVKYCTKVDTRIGGPWTNIEGLRFRKTIQDPLLGLELYSWQKDILTMLEKTPDDRKVYWYWDRTGNSGKTSLAKHICLRYKSAIYLNGCSRDVLCAISKQLEERDVDIAIFGLSRQDYNQISYKSLEILKDGIGFSGKYESGMFMCGAMHVIVFANFPPILSHLSIDRWQIVNIADDTDE